jgi:hypothetical protein
MVFGRLKRARPGKVHGNSNSSAQGVNDVRFENLTVVSILGTYTV